MCSLHINSTVDSPSTSERHLLSHLGRNVEIDCMLAPLAFQASLGTAAEQLPVAVEKPEEEINLNESSETVFATECFSYNFFSFSSVVRGFHVKMGFQSI